MTRTNAMESAGSAAAPRPEDGKAVLVCPHCAHESPIRGDWLLVVEEDRLCVYCPDCWTQLTERPR